jgi:SOS-response transcriptional repressor LexA
MITIPQELRPPALLWTDDLSEAAKGLKENCQRLDHVTDLRLLDSWRQAAEDLLSGGHDNGCAVVKVCLADLYRECGEFGSALSCSEEAARTICHWSRIHHRHNHAVALYSMGLAHHFMGSGQDALDRYDEALEVFETAKGQWILDGEEGWLARCEVAMRWVETLRTRLAQSRFRGEPIPRTKVLVPVLSKIAAGEPMLAGEDFDEWVEVEVQRAARINFALRVQGDSMADEILEGDLVLVEQNQSVPPNGQIVVILIDQVDEEATLKRFYRKKDHVLLEPANASHPLIALTPASVSKTDIHQQYLQSHPKRLLRVYPGVEPWIIGWFRDVV